MQTSIVAHTLLVTLSKTSKRYRSITKTFLQYERLESLYVLTGRAQKGTAVNNDSVYRQEYRLSQMDPRDALPHAHRAAHIRGGQSM